jgi:hypothetical protein
MPSSSRTRFVGRSRAVSVTSNRGRLTGRATPEVPLRPSAMTSTSAGSASTPKPEPPRRKRPKRTPATRSAKRMRRLASTTPGVHRLEIVLLPNRHHQGRCTCGWRMTGRQVDIVAVHQERCLDPLEQQDSPVAEAPR